MKRTATDCWHIARKIEGLGIFASIARAFSLYLGGGKKTMSNKTATDITSGQLGDPINDIKEIAATLKRSRIANERARAEKQKISPNLYKRPEPVKVDWGKTPPIEFEGSRDPQTLMPIRGIRRRSEDILRLVAPPKS